VSPGLSHKFWACGASAVIAKMMRFKREATLKMMVRGLGGMTSALYPGTIYEKNRAIFEALRPGFGVRRLATWELQELSSVVECPGVFETAWLTEHPEYDVEGPPVVAALPDAIGVVETRLVGQIRGLAENQKWQEDLHAACIAFRDSVRDAFVRHRGNCYAYSHVDAAIVGSQFHDQHCGFGWFGGDRIRNVN
jgi:hypothetical protein